MSSRRSTRCTSAVGTWLGDGEVRLSEEEAEEVEVAVEEPFTVVLMAGREGWLEDVVVFGEGDDIEAWRMSRSESRTVVWTIKRNLGLLCC